MSHSALTLVDGRVITLDAKRPAAEAVVILDGRIAYVGDSRRALLEAGRHALVIQLGGQTVVPGLIDPHCHVIAAAAARLAVDCTSACAQTLAQLLARIQEAAASLAPGQWVRAFGYDEALLAERRHPIRAELDNVAPRHPVQLKHRSGHAVVLSSRACAELGLPLEAWGDGLFRDSPPGPPIVLSELGASAALLSREWLRYGVTRLCDAGSANGLAEFRLLDAWRRDGTISQALSVLCAPEHLQAVAAAEVEAVATFEGAKVMLEERTLCRQELVDLERLIRGRTGQEWVAIHVVELGALAALIDLLEQLAADGVPLDRCRLEHVSLCPPHWVSRLSRLGVRIVTQPAFLVERGEKYRETVPAEQHSWLYPIGSLVSGGLQVAASSDCPVADVNPFGSMRSALERRSRCGFRFPDGAPISRLQALELVTSRAAAVLSSAHEAGRISPGYRADLAVLDRDPLRVPLEELPETRALLTCVDGAPFFFYPFELTSALRMIWRRSSPRQPPTAGAARTASLEDGVIPATVGTSDKRC